MSQPELLKAILATLNRMQVPHMLVGSLAAAFHSEPRLTHDIDLLVSLDVDDAATLASAFPLPDFYLDELAAADAIRRVSQFNLLDATSAEKVDFYLISENDFDQSQFARRIASDFEGEPMFVPTAEDTIVAKLRWAELAGGSEKQLKDVQNIYEMKRASLNESYISTWASRLTLDALWEQVKRRSNSM